MSTALELIRAGTEHRSALENLLELYIHDFSELVPRDVGEDGRYGYKNLPLFWSDNSRLPFLARLDGKIVGFALVTQSSEPPGDGEAWDMAEFFVLRRYRHRGIGIQLAEKVWLHCPGRWQIRVHGEECFGSQILGIEYRKIHRPTSAIHKFREGRSRMASVFTRLAPIATSLWIVGLSRVDGLI